MSLSESCAWIQLHLADTEAELWLRVSQINAVCASALEAPGSDAFNFPGHPVGARHAALKPYTRVITHDGTYRVSEPLDKVLDLMAEAGGH